jgi:DNA-binding NarL/FixJ family response regulator
LNRLRVILADDEPNFLALAVRLLERDFEIVKTVGDGQQLVEAALHLKPDLLLLDISMLALNGLEAARRLRSAGCQAKMVFLSVHCDPDYVQAGFAAGASGYVFKGRLVFDLPLALQEVLAGRSFVSPSISRDKAS